MFIRNGGALNAGWVLVVASMFLNFSSSAVELPAAPELKVLARFIGTWECESTAKKTEWAPQETHSTAVDVAKWILDGSHVEIEIQTSEKQSLKVILSYDSAKQMYRSWTFGPNGYCLENQMQWNEKTKTFSGKYEVTEGVTCETTARFVDDDTYEWNWLAKDAKGTIYVDTHGKKTRKK